MNPRQDRCKPVPDVKNTAAGKRSINGRAETRTYAKPVMGGEGEVELSPEEAQAIHTAQRGAGSPAPAPAPASPDDRATPRAEATA